MPTVLKDSLWILLPSLALTALSIFLGWDEALAQKLHNPSSELAWMIRQHSSTPGMVLSVLFLCVMLMPWRKKFPTLRRISMMWMFTLIFAGGLFVHVIVKDMADRPRPRETVLLGGDAEFSQPFASYAELKGKSFPSGHTAMAAAFIIPVFVLRRRYKKTAIALGIFALSYTALVSWARMTLGAHFFTDCLWGFSIIGLGASVSRSIIKQETDIPVKYIISILSVVAFCIVWFNKFKLTLSINFEDASHITKIDLPCDIDRLRPKSSKGMALEVTFKGYGAPLSWLALKEKDGRIFFQRHFGLYRGITCQVDKFEVNMQHPILATELNG